MNAPVLWILFPTTIAVLLFFLRKREMLVKFLGTLLCFALALIAWTLPIDMPVETGFFTFQINSTLPVLGRRLIIGSGNSGAIAFFYLIGAFWFLGTFFLKVKKNFVPLCLFILTILITAYSVEPFLYSALFIEFAVLTSVPLLTSSDEEKSIQGILRFVVFQTLAMPFILLAGWTLTVIDADPSDTRLMTQAAALLGMGFAFWLAVFPFYSWIPSLSEQTESYTAGFVLFVLQTTVLLLLLNYLDGFSWIREHSRLPEILRVFGLAMVLSSGIWSIFQKEFNRIFGHFIILETGVALIALSVGFQSGIKIYALQFLPRLIAFFVWNFCLALLQQKERELNDELELQEDPLSYARVPFIGLLFSYFSISGLPTLAGFPIRLILAEQIGKLSPLTLGFFLAGNLGFTLGGLQLMTPYIKAILSYGTGKKIQPFTPIIVFCIILMLLFGLLPQFFLPPSLEIISPYLHLK